MSDKRTMVICSGDVNMFERLAEQCGYDVVGAAEVAVSAERLVAHHEPDVVLVDNDIAGITGFDALPMLREASPLSQLLLVVTDDWEPHDMGSIGALAVVTRSRLDSLADELGRVHDWLAERVCRPSASGVERRHRPDRRTRQDWSKVGWERRATRRRETVPDSEVRGG